MATTEPTINDALAGVLRECRAEWSRAGVVRSENTRALSGLQRPDILVVEPGGSPVVIETELLPANLVEKEAKERLGLELRDNARLIFASIAVRLPRSLRDLDGSALRKALMTLDHLEFICFTGANEDVARRWPGRGWISGSAADLCLAAQAMTVPPEIVDDAADRLVRGVKQVAARMDDLAAEYGGALQHIAETLRQEDGVQTRRMAATILVNAFIFHCSLAGRPGRLAPVRPIASLRRASNRISSADLLNEWRKILEVNYWPIFDIARRVVESIPAHVASSILTGVAETADAVLESGLTKSHDLVGAVFQSLIADRKFLAAFYTRPASAALLAGLALSPRRTPKGQSWLEPNHVTELRFADFACGTGTLLSTLYHLCRQYHEILGGDEAQLHSKMMSDALVGCDIMPAATHITASMLSGAHPDIAYEQSAIMTMPYGLQPNGGISLGALDLLQEQRTLSILSTQDAAAISGTGERTTDAWRAIPDASFDVVIMNPPFTRPTNHEGNKAGVPNPMFAAFASSAQEQKAMSGRLQTIAANTAYHGNAGEGSAFLALADKKLAPGGQLAMVLPLSLQVGRGWEKSRTLITRSYSDVMVVSIAGNKDADASFSADTDMAECLLLAKKGGRSDRAHFVILSRAPSSSLEGTQLSRIIAKLRMERTRALEDGPYGGTPICLGDETVGHMVNGPLSASAPWPISRISDISVAQVAFQLAVNGVLWLPGTEKSNALPISTCCLGSLATLGPLHRDINGAEYAGGLPRGPFAIEALSRDEEPTYPVLWNHNADAERRMVVGPDQKAAVRVGANSAEDTILREKAARVWATASRCHFNLDFRFNSQSTGACYTEAPCIGGRAWPTVKFSDERYEKAFILWCNSSLGLLCHWWHTNRQQSGRGSITLTTLPLLGTLDFRSLSDSQLEKSAEVFAALRDKGLRPFHEIAADPVRHELDRAVW